MSLLMDALRKAEEAKRAAAQSDNTAPAAPLPMVEPVAPHASSTPSPLQELGLEPLSPPAAPPRESAAPPAAASDAAMQRQAVQNAFAAKKVAHAPGDKVFMLALAGVAALTALGIGAYVWWQMQPRSPLLATAPALPPPPAPAAQPTMTPDTPPVAAASSAAFARLPETDAVERSEQPPAAAPPAPDPVRITRNPTRVNPLLEQGYAALQQGNLVQAQQAYERMLGTDARNADALYGLAAIALQRQQTGLAEDYYLRILEADPRDAYAHAGLTGLRGRASGSQAESRLKTLIAEQPGVAPLHFALGNLYAQEQRWRDAQQSYFLAFQNDSGNPDMAFNLAVSLDQLHQGRLAAQYYSEALRLSARQPGAFSREQTQLRLRELQASGAQP